MGMCLITWFHARNCVARDPGMHQRYGWKRTVPPL